MEDIQKIGCHSFMPHEKKRFSGSLTNGKLAVNSKWHLAQNSRLVLYSKITLYSKGDYFEENECFIHCSFLA